MTSKLPHLVFAFVLAAGALVPASPAAAQKADGKPACGLRHLPLVAGNTWTYRSGTSQVTVKVVAVGQGKDHAGKAATTIDVEETYGTRVVKSTWTCTASTGVQISPDSVLFSGEPGGGIGATLNITSRDNATLLTDSMLRISGQAWVEAIKGDATRADMGKAGAQHPAAKVEIERHNQVKGNENVVYALGQADALKVQFEFRGRGVVNAEKSEIPIKRPGMFWFVRNVGVVKFDDAFDKTWDLVESNVVTTAKK